MEHQLDDTSVDQTEQLSLNQHGHLVQQILDSQKEFSQVNGKTEIVSSQNTICLIKTRDLNVTIIAYLYRRNGSLVLKKRGKHLIRRWS